MRCEIRSSSAAPEYAAACSTSARRFSVATSMRSLISTMFGKISVINDLLGAAPQSAAVHVTVPGVIGPGAELVVKNESDQPIRVIADPHETLTLKTRERPTDER